MKDKNHIVCWLTDDTLDVGKKPMERSRLDEGIREKLDERIKNGEFITEFYLDDRPIEDKIKEFEKKHGEIKPLTDDELKQYGL